MSNEQAIPEVTAADLMLRAETNMRTCELLLASAKEALGRGEGGRELAVALTQLETATMWLCRARLTAKGTRQDGERPAE